MYGITDDDIKSIDEKISAYLYKLKIALQSK